MAKIAVNMLVQSNQQCNKENFAYTHLHWAKQKTQTNLTKYNQLKYHSILSVLDIQASS